MGLAVSSRVANAAPGDLDSDSIADASDNCPNVFNPLQWDRDNDGLGDNCDIEVVEINTGISDAMIESNRASTNLGTGGHVFAFSGPYVETDVLFKFDASSINTARCTQVKLFLNQQIKSPVQVTVHAVLGPWDEATITWGNFPRAYEAAPVYSYTAAQNNVAVGLDISGLARDWASGARVNYGILIKTGGGAVKYGAHERFIAQQRPHVRITCQDHEPGVEMLVAQNSDVRRPQLYRINAVTGAASPIGSIGFGITGMAMAPDGRVFATTDTNGRSGELVEINPTTGAATSIGSTTSSADGINRSMLVDCTFSANQLYCWSGDEDALVRIDTTNGNVTVVGGGTSSWGSGLAAAANGTLYLAPHGSSGQLYTIDPATGAVTPTVTMNGTLGDISAMSFMNGTLYAIENDASHWELVSIDPATGNVRRIFHLPLHVDAIAPRQRG